MPPKSSAPLGSTGSRRDRAQPVRTVVHTSTNKLALTSFILLVLLGPVAAPAALPLAFVAQRQCVRSAQHGAGLAKTSVLIGVAYLVFAGIVALLLLLVPT